MPVPPLSLDALLVPPKGASVADQLLLRRLSVVISAQLANPALSPAGLAAAVYLSERTLYRRLRALTGYGPAGFVRELRLRRARLLLQMGEVISVVAVAHAVGFINAAHFGQTYVRRFGHPPGQDQSS